MNTHSKRPPKVHLISGLPLFDWRSAVVHQPVTRAGIHVRNRFPVRPEIADLIASLAGLGSAVDR